MHNMSHTKIRYENQTTTLKLTRKLYNGGRLLRCQCSHWHYFLLQLFRWTFMLYSPLSIGISFFYHHELNPLDVPMFNKFLP